MFDVDTLNKQHPECKLILYPLIESGYIHCFIPYLDVLFEYLINKNNRIVFFSAGPENRNISVIERLLVSLFGENNYQILKQQGQFEVFSSQHLREAIYEKGEIYNNHIKDLKIVLKENESIANTILIEDQPFYAAYDQTPCIIGIKLENLFNSNNKEKNFSKNATYYLLGLFKEYFNSSLNLNEKFEPIRDWLDKFLFNNVIDFSSYKYGNEYHNQGIYHHVPNILDDWAINLIVHGFNEVQKKHPNATLYYVSKHCSCDAASSINLYNKNGNVEDSVDNTNNISKKINKPSKLKLNYFT